MEYRRAIKQATQTLVNDMELNAILNRTGEVRVAVLPDICPFRPSTDEVPTNQRAPVVTFTIEETHFGRRLMAEFQGQKEFVA